MPAFQVGLLGCLQAGRSYLFYAATTGNSESFELAFAVEVPTWKTLA
jgi:hypothetical protein